MQNFKSMDNMKYGIHKIFKRYYDYSCKFAESNEEGRVFTDHNREHVDMVLDKTCEVIKAFQKYISLETKKEKIEDGIIPFSKDVNWNVVIASSLAHDTGMNGLGYALVKNINGEYVKNKGEYYQVIHINPESYSQVRINHGLNSAINVLANRDNLKKLGYLDTEIDEIATICMAHFISTSGIKDVNSKEDWKECFNRIDSAIIAYNFDHLDLPIFYERNLLEKDNRLSTLATEVIGIRLGDVSRDSGSEAKSQSGEIVYVDRKTLNNEGGNIEAEIKNASITIGKDKKTITFEKSRQVHAGEQNIVYNHTFVGKDKFLNHEIIVEDGSSVPKCTQQAIHDHLRVLASAPREYFVVRIIFHIQCTNYAKLSYEEFRRKCNREYKNIVIVYPWDESI